MQQSKVLINEISSKNKRAYKLLEFYLKKEVSLFKENLLPEQVREIATQIPFKELRGSLYSFFDRNNILVSVSPYGIEFDGDDFVKCKWKFNIVIDDNDIIESDFDKREYAEFISFQRAFQFLDTKLFIEQTKNRFYDETADSSCLNVNWGHLNKVLNHKRKIQV
jgi:hypothetical protein